MNERDKKQWLNLIERFGSAKEAQLYLEFEDACAAMGGPVDADDAWANRARIAEQREAELVKVLKLLVNRKWSIASPIHARPDNEDAATHLMCSVEKQIIDKARAILATHDQTDEEVTP